jgi:hypothetical protein
MRLAVRAGNQPAAAVLQALGAAADDVTEIDQLIGAVSSLQAERARAIVRQHPGVVSKLSQEDIDIVLRAAAGNGLAHVQLLLDIGIDPGAAGHGGATALHVAAWHGHVEMVRLLLGRGAPVDATDTVYRKRPIDWAVHGSRHCRTADDEYRQVIAALEKAGANEA